MFRLSVRNLVLFSTLLIVVFSFGSWIYHSRSQKLAVDYAIDHGAIVRYGFQIDQDSKLTLKQRPPGIPKFLVRWLGIDYFAKVVSIRCTNRDRLEAFRNPRELPPFDFKKISSLNHLRTLTVSEGEFVNPESLASLPRLKHLRFRTLNLEWFVSDSSRNLSVDEAKLKFLEKLKHLETLELPWNCEAAILHLKNFSSLRELNIGGDQFRIVDRGFIYYAFQKRTVSKKLQKKSNQIVLKNLQDMKELRKLVYSGSGDLSSDISFVKNLYKIRKLRSLRLASISGIDASKFSDHERLQHLEFENCTFVNFLSLAKLKNLKSLKLSQCEIPDQISENLFGEGFDQKFYQDLNQLVSGSLYTRYGSHE